jgi:hypothetical protein
MGFCLGGMNFKAGVVQTTADKMVGVSIQYLKRVEKDFPLINKVLV